eukprot:jgi/Chlat1/5097/Chrsp33S05107
MLISAVAKIFTALIAAKPRGADVDCRGGGDDIGLRCIDLTRAAANMGLEEDFNTAADNAKKLPESTTNEEKLILYGLFKQATVGDCDTQRPGMFNMRDRAKWDAWNANKGMDKETAKQNYVAKVEQLAEQYNVQLA